MTHLTKSEIKKNNRERNKHQQPASQQRHQQKSNIFTFFRIFFSTFILNAIQLKLFPEIGPIQLVEIYCATQKRPLRRNELWFSLSPPPLTVACFAHWFSIRIVVAFVELLRINRRYWLVRNLFHSTLLPSSNPNRTASNVDDEAFGMRKPNSTVDRARAKKKSYKRYIVSKAPSKSNKSSC